MAAGAATKKGVIGYVVPFGIPEVVRHANAFTLGAQATHPGAKVKLVWTNAWFSPPKEKAAQASSRPAPTCSARTSTARRPALRREARDPLGRLRLRREEVRAEAVADRLGLQLGPVLPARVKAAINGTWKPGFYYGSIKDGFTGLAPFGPKVSAKTKALIAAKKEAIVDRQVLRVLRPAQRPERQAEGPEGQVPRPDKAGSTLYSMQWLVQGRGRHRLQGPAAGLAGGEQPPARRRRREAPATPAPLPAVAMRGITKRFPGVLANDAVDFEAAAGEVHALLGENGAGKTTLSNILTGLYRPDEGDDRASTASRSTSHSPSDAIDAGIGMVHQHFRLVAAVHRRREHRPRRAPAGGAAASSSTRARIERRVAELGERYGLAVDPRARVGSSRSASSSASRS